MVFDRPPCFSPSNFSDKGERWGVDRKLSTPYYLRQIWLEWCAFFPSLKCLSVVGLPGGAMFTIFFFLFGKTGDVKVYRDMLHEHGDNPDLMWLQPGYDKFAASLRTKYYMPFVSFAGQCGKAVSQKQNSLVFDVGVVCKSYGMSDRGNTFLAKMNVVTGGATYWRKETELLSTYDLEMKNIITHSDMYAIMVDNFSQMKYRQGPEVVRGLQFNADFTGVNLIRGGGPSLAFLLDHDGSIIPAWPDDLANDTSVAAVHEAFAIIRQANFWRGYYDNKYYCIQQNITNYPPKDAATEVHRTRTTR